MKLNAAERDYYVLQITTEPALDGTWEASFDGGANWADGTETDDGWAWLVAGPDFEASAVGMDDADTIATIVTATRPLVRLKDNPVVDIERAPTIRVTHP